MDLELETEEEGNAYRTWLRVFGGADICMSPIGVMVLVFYIHQCKIYMKLWMESSNNTVEWFDTRTSSYRAVLQYTGNLENSTSRAIQLHGIYNDIIDRCGPGTNEKVSNSSSYIAIPFIANLVAQVLNFMLGLSILYYTRDESDATPRFARLALFVLILILLLESISCHLLSRLTEIQLCPVLKLANHAYCQALFFIILFRAPHIIAAYKYWQVVSVAEYERQRKERENLMMKTKRAKSQGMLGTGLLQQLNDMDDQQKIRIVTPPSPPNELTFANDLYKEMHESLDDSSTSSIFEGTSVLFNIVPKREKFHNHLTAKNKQAQKNDSNTHSHIPADNAIDSSSNDNATIRPVVTAKNTLNLARKSDECRNWDIEEDFTSGSGSTYTVFSTLDHKKPCLQTTKIEAADNEKTNTSSKPVTLEKDRQTERPALSSDDLPLRDIAFTERIPAEENLVLAANVLFPNVDLPDERRHEESGKSKSKGESPLPLSPPREQAFNATAASTGAEDDDQGDLLSDLPTNQEDVHNTPLEASPILLVPTEELSSTEESGLDVRTSDIAPGRGRVHITVMRPKTRRKSENNEASINDSSHPEEITSRKTTPSRPVKVTVKRRKTKPVDDAVRLKRNNRRQSK